MLPLHRILDILTTDKAAYYEAGSFPFLYDNTSLPYDWILNSSKIGWINCYRTGEALLHDAGATKTRKANGMGKKYNSAEPNQPGQPKLFSGSSYGRWSVDDRGKDGAQVGVKKREGGSFVFFRGA
jgi:hypothetical protein